MAGQTVGLNECCEHSILGSTYLAFDKVESGSMTYEGGEVKENEGTGGQVATYRDMVVPVGNVSTMLQVGTLLTCIEPASVGALPTIIEKIQGGTTTAAQGRLHEDCYLKTVKFSCARGGVLMVDYSWIALSETDGTTITPVTKQTATPFPWHNMTVTFATAALACQSWEVTVDTGVEAQTSQDLKVSGVQRLPEWIDPGPFSVSLSASVRIPRTFSFAADYPAAMAFNVVAVNNSGSTFTLDMSGGEAVHLNGDPIELVKGKEAVLYKIDGKCKTNDLAAFAASIA